MQMCNKMKKTGFYVIKDQFFLDMNEPYLKGNKKGNRPHYYCFEDAESGVYWMIPLSSRVEKYRAILNKRLAAGKPCDTLYIAKLDNDRESAFLIQDIFPITENYIEREYTIAGNPMMLTSEQLSAMWRSVPEKSSVCSSAVSNLPPPSPMYFGCWNF